MYSPLLTSLISSFFPRRRKREKIFDPNFHEAVSEQENNEVDSGTVILELQKGYLLNDRLIRPAMVVVSKKNAKKD